VLLELHPFGMDNAQGERFVDVDLGINGGFVKTLQFVDRRGTGTVDVGNVYVPLDRALLGEDVNQVALTWVDGERWVQLQDVALSGPTGRQGTQETWEIGVRDGSFGEFGAERLVDDSYLVGDDPETFEQALHVADEPITDILFELSDIGVDRVLRLVADETHNGLGVTVEISVNNAIVGEVTLTPSGEETVEISKLLLREGWNHIRLRHANVPGDGEFILWDYLALEQQTATGHLQVLVRNVNDDALAPAVQFGGVPPGGAVVGGHQYLEIHYVEDEAFECVTIATDNRNAPIHRFTGPDEASAAGLVGQVDSAIAVPLLWQVYDETQPSAPVFTDTVEWAFVVDASQADFNTPAVGQFRTLVNTSGLGDRPSPGRGGSSPIAVYLVADFLGKPAQAYTTDRLLIELIRQ